MAIVEKIDGKEGLYLVECPGCKMAHAIHTARYSSPRWEFDGNMESPTFSPSILVRWDEGTPPVYHVCHSYIIKGQWQFLSDCTHALAGQTVPMIDVE